MSKWILFRRTFPLTKRNRNSIRLYSSVCTTSNFKFRIDRNPVHVDNLYTTSSPKTLKASRFPTHPNIWWMSGKYTEFVSITIFALERKFRHHRFFQYIIRWQKTHPNYQRESSCIENWTEHKQSRLFRLA